MDDELTHDLVLAVEALPAPHLLTGDRPALSLETVIALWLDAKHQRSGSQKTLRAYADGIHVFRALLLEVGLDLDGDAIKVATVAQAWAGRQVSGAEVAPATFNQRLAILSSFYAFAAKRKSVAGNPIPIVERRRVEQYAGARSLDYRQLKRLMQAIDRTDLTGARDYAVLSVTLQTGRRLTEIAGLRWRNVHVTEGMEVTLDWSRTKGGKVMRDELPPPVGRALLAYLQCHYGPAWGDLSPDAPIWVNFSPHNHGQALTIRSLARICAARLVSTFHTLRHTFAHGMEDAGAKVTEIQARLGHASLATTGRYLGALKQARNPQATALAELFGFDDGEGG